MTTVIKTNSDLFIIFFFNGIISCLYLSMYRYYVRNLMKKHESIINQQCIDSAMCLVLMDSVLIAEDRNTE